jgi:hypothetical protein
MSARARCASGARSPEAPTDPCSGTTGRRSAASIRSRLSTVETRIPENPFARALALRTIISAHDAIGERTPDARGMAPHEVL